MSQVRVGMDQRTAVLVYAYINSIVEGTDMPELDQHKLEKFLARLDRQIDWSEEAVERLRKSGEEE